MFEAMVFILRTGIPWRDLAARYGPWNSVYTRWRRCCQAGLWTKLLAVLPATPKASCVFWMPVMSKCIKRRATPPAASKIRPLDAPRFQHQDQCLGGRTGTGSKFESGTRTARRRMGRANGVASEIAWHDHGGRQGLRPRRFPGTIAKLGQSPLHPAARPSPGTGGVASWSLPEAPQGGELVPTIETLPQNRHSL